MNEQGKVVYGKSTGFYNFNSLCFPKKKLVSDCRAQFMKEIRMLKEKGKPDGVKEKTDGLLAAMKIQKLWRGFATRRKTRRRKLEEMYLIGMIPRPNDKKNVLNEEMENVSQVENFSASNLKIDKTFC